MNAARAIYSVCGKRRLYAGEMLKTGVWVGVVHVGIGATLRLK